MKWLGYYLAYHIASLIDLITLLEISTELKDFKLCISTYRMAGTFDEFILVDWRFWEKSANISTCQIVYSMMSSFCTCYVVTSSTCDLLPRIVYRGETYCVRNTKIAYTAESIFHAGESCQRPDLKLQQWGDAKDNVDNDWNCYQVVQKWCLCRTQLRSQEMRRQVTHLSF